MAIQHVEINVKTNTGYDQLYPSNNASYCFFSTAGTYLTSTNVANALDELAIKVNTAQTSADSRAASLSVSNATLTLSNKSGATLSAVTVNNVANALGCSGASYSAERSKNFDFGIGSGQIVGYEQQMSFRPSGERDYWLDMGIVDGAWALAPEQTSMLDLGRPNNRWTTLYISSPSISTSDRTLKKDIIPADAIKMLQFIMHLQAVSYKFLDGTSGRTHYGFIAQDVEQALAECGMTDMEFAAFIKSPKYETIQVFTDEYLDEETFEIVPASMHEESVLVPNEYIYGLRYEEFIAPIISVVQEQAKKAASMEERLSLLEKRMNNNN